jgi:hypothetical protein
MATRHLGVAARFRATSQQPWTAISGRMTDYNRSSMGCHRRGGWRSADICRADKPETERMTAAAL